nr:Chain B, Unknown peptide, probably from expression host [Escherichia coli BL21(DE3)]3RTC_B Chain B, Unknown peptide, probably from expression host [Escherichia coli BL21(DE3)]
APAWLFEA